MSSKHTASRAPCAYERSAVIFRTSTRIEDENEQHFICLVKRLDVVIFVDSIKFAYTIRAEHQLWIWRTPRGERDKQQCS